MADDNEDDDCALQGWIDSLTASFNHCWWSPETFNPPLNQLRSDWWSSSWNRKWDIKKTFLLGVQKWSITWITKGGGCDHKCHFRIIPFPTRLLLLPMFPMWNFYRRWSYYPAQSFCILPIPSASSSSSQCQHQHQPCSSNSSAFIWIIKHLSFIIVIIYHLSFIML